MQTIIRGFVTAVKFTVKSAAVVLVGFVFWAFTFSVIKEAAKAGAGYNVGGSGTGGAPVEVDVPTPAPLMAAEEVAALYVRYADAAANGNADEAMSFVHDDAPHRDEIRQALEKTCEPNSGKLVMLVSHRLVVRADATGDVKIRIGRKDRQDEFLVQNVTARRDSQGYWKLLDLGKYKFVDDGGPITQMPDADE